MRTARRVYALGAAASAASQVAAAFAGFLSLLILARVLSKDMLGGYAFGMAIMALLAHVATLGLDRSLLLRIAPFRERAERMHGGGLAARVTLAAILAGAVIAVLLSVSAEAAVRWGALPEAAFWLPALSLSVMPLAATFALQAWYQANHRVPVAMALPGLADLLRSLLFAGVFLGGLGAAGVAGAVTLAATAPALLLVGLAWGRTRASPRHLGGQDFAKGLQFLVLRLSTQGIRQLDLILMGLLATGSITAEYAVAVRLASLVDAPRAALSPSFVPRARRWLALGDHAAAQEEYDQSRQAALAAALAGIAAFALLGQPLLHLFGSTFDAAYAPLLVLAAGHMLNAGFGMHASYLAMSGEVGWSAMLRLTGLAVFVGLNLLLIPRFGSLGAAGAMLATEILVNVAGATLAYRLTGLRAVNARLLGIMALGLLAVGLVAGGVIGPGVGALLLLLAMAAPAIRSAAALDDLLGPAAERLRHLLAGILRR